ncbi:hypothetical protein, partial [Ruminococcus callidus]
GPPPLSGEAIMKIDFRGTKLMRKMHHQIFRQSFSKKRNRACPQKDKHGFSKAMRKREITAKFKNCIWKCD